MIGTKELTIKEPTIVENPANSNKDVAAVQQGSMANDHEASTSKAKSRDPKYTQPRWCPFGLTKAQKRRLQRMRSHEKEEQEAEKQRDKLFNERRPMVPPKQVWRPKQKENVAASALIVATPTLPTEDDATAITSSTSPITSSSLRDISESGDMLEDGDDMLDYESTPIHEGMDINMVYYLPAEFRAIDEEGEVAQLDFGLKMLYSRSQKNR